MLAFFPKNVLCSFRDEINVKGKGMMRVYLVEQDENLRVRNIEPEPEMEDDRFFSERALLLSQMKERIALEARSSCDSSSCSSSSSSSPSSSDVEDDFSSVRRVSSSSSSSSSSKTSSSSDIIKVAKLKPEEITLAKWRRASRYKN